MCLLGVVAALVGVVLLALLSRNAPRAYTAIGVGAMHQAVVTERVEDDAPPLVRRNCRVHTRFEVAWEGGAGRFGSCAPTTLAVGDRVEVATVPWSDEVSSDPGDLGWELVLLAMALGFTVLGARWAHRYLRLTQGGAAPAVRGRVDRIGTAVTIVPAPDEEDRRRMLLLPAARRLKVAPGAPVTVWASRRGLGGREKGPWVVSCRGQVSVATHAVRWPVRD